MKGVLPIIDVHLPTGEHSAERAWLVMPIAVPIRRALGDQPRVSVVVDAWATVASTLAELHARGISHRDVKPENLYRHGDEWVIGDFGLVHAPDVEPLTVGAAALGPRYYLAPEMLNEPATGDGRTADVYSLAKTAWILLTGQTYPPPGEHRMDVPALCVSSYIDAPGSAALDSLLASMTSYSPFQRPSMRQVADELNAWQEPDAATPAIKADLARVAARVHAASMPTQTRADARRERLERVESAAEEFTRLAQPLAQEIQDGGLPVFLRSPGDEPAFNTDASDLLPHAIGPLATMTVLGTEPPVTRAAGLLLRTDDTLPQLKLWIGVAVIQGKPEANFVSGAALLLAPHGPRPLWSETQIAVLGGPRTRVVMNHLLWHLRNHLDEDLAAWLRAVELSG